MKERLRLWRQRASALWQARTRRERVLIGLTAGLALAVLLDALILRPLADARQRLRGEIAQLAQQALLAEQLAARITTQGPSQPTKQDLLSFVDAEARRLGLKKALARVRPLPAAQGQQRMLVEMREAPFEAVLKMLEAAQKAGIDWQRLRMQRASSPGYVHLRVEFVQ